MKNLKQEKLVALSLNITNAYTILILDFLKQFKEAAILVSGILHSTGPELGVKDVILRMFRILKEFVDDTNARFHDVILEIRKTKNGIMWLAPPEIDVRRHLTDHSHLNEK